MIEQLRRTQKALMKISNQLHGNLKSDLDLEIGILTDHIETLQDMKKNLQDSNFSRDFDLK